MSSDLTVKPFAVIIYSDDCVLCTNEYETFQVIRTTNRFYSVKCCSISFRFGILVGERTWFQFLWQHQNEPIRKANLIKMPHKRISVNFSNHGGSSKGFHSL